MSRRRATVRRQARGKFRKCFGRPKLDTEPRSSLYSKNLAFRSANPCRDVSCKLGPLLAILRGVSICQFKSCEFWPNLKPGKSYKNPKILCRIEVSAATCFAAK